ncbi:MAG: hypothetical protein ACLU1U_06795 [Lachnospiraceae bacterium]
MCAVILCGIRSAGRILLTHSQCVDLSAKICIAWRYARQGERY